MTESPVSTHGQLDTIQNLSSWQPKQIHILTVFFPSSPPQSNYGRFCYQFICMNINIYVAIATTLTPQIKGIYIYFNMAGVANYAQNSSHYLFRILICLHYAPVFIAIRIW